MEYWPARIATRSVAGGSVGVLRQVRIAPRSGVEVLKGRPINDALSNRQHGLQPRRRKRWWAQILPRCYISGWALPVD